MTIVSGTADVIKAIIEAVPRTGVVYEYDPFPTEGWEKFVQTFTTVIDGDLVLRAWTIKNTHRDTVPVTLSPTSEIQRVHLRWLIRGFLAVSADGASDATFRDLLEAVTDALNTNRRLTGAPSVYDHDPADYDLPNNGALLSLGNTICHYGEVTFTSHHEIVVAVV